MRRALYPALSLVLGCLVTLLLAAVFVKQSNLYVYEKVEAIRAAGFLPVPNRHVSLSLITDGTAWAGGVFYALSLGAAVSVITVCLAWSWRRLSGRGTKALLFLVLAWSGAVVWCLGQGPWFLPAVVGLVPPLVFIAAHGLRGPDDRAGPWAVAFFLVPLMTAGGLWAVQTDQDVFVNLRDCWLMSNPVGSLINDEYYRYSLFAAEAFKTLEQKTVNTCRVSPSVSGGVRAALLAHDFLPLDEYAGRVDLELRRSGRALYLLRQDRVVVVTTAREFFRSPEEVLGAFSRGVDRSRSLRRVIWYGLLYGAPAALYLFLYSLTHGFFYIFTPKRARLLACLACLAVVLILLWPMYDFYRMTHRRDTPVRELLASVSWKEQVAGLRAATLHGYDLGQNPDYRGLMNSPHAAVRYWLAVALGCGRSAETRRDLLRLLDDPHPNVACMAFRSLGQRGASTDLPNVLPRIESSRHWYVQWYAYRCLRSLGWVQTGFP